MRRNISSCAFVIESDRFRKRNLIRIRKTLQDASNPLELPTHLFIQKFRMDKEPFLYVLRKLNLNSGTRQTYILNVIRLAIALETLASGGYQWLPGSDYSTSVTQNTLSLVVSEMVQIMEEKLCSEWIQWRIDPSAKEYLVIGCIDGTHVYFNKPKQ